MVPLSALLSIISLNSFVARRTILTVARQKRFRDALVEIRLDNIAVHKIWNQRHDLLCNNDSPVCSEATEKGEHQLNE